LTPFAVAAAPAPAPPAGRHIDFLFALSVALLFTNIEIRLDQYVEWLRIRIYPTLPVMALTTALALVGVGRERPLLRTLSWTLLLFAGVHVASAFSLRLSNGVRELLQGGLVFAFTLAFAARYSTHPLRQFAAMFAPMAAIIMAYNIGWHLVNGYYWGWKRLDEPKALFDLAPLLVAAWIWTRPRFPAVLGSLLLVGVGLLILLSGERKAYVAFGLALLLLLNPKHPAAYLAPLVGLAGLFVAVEVIDSAYVTRQVQTLLAAVGLGPTPDSISSVMREWQARVGIILFETSPVFGIGTNGFLEVTQREYTSAEYYYVGLHGEFLRILVENGVVGVAVYGAMLLFAASRLLRPAPGQFANSREYRTALLWFTSLLVYTSFEGANQLLMVLQFSLAYVPLLNFGPHWRPPPLSAPAAAAGAPESRGMAAYPQLAGAQRLGQSSGSA